MQKLIFLFIFSFFTAEICNAQNYLSLRRNDKNFKQFIPGNEINLTVKNGVFKKKISGRIDSICEDVIFIYGEKAYLQDVIKIRISRENFNYKSGGFNLMLAGVLLGSLLYTNDREEAENRPFYIASAVLFTGGAAMIAYADRTFKINQKNKLIIVKPF